MRKVLKLHKWIALIIGVQILIWILGGVVMSIIPIEKVRGSHKVTQRYVPTFEVSELMPLAEAADKAGIGHIKQAEVGTLLGRPVWRPIDSADNHYVIDGNQGRILSPISEGLALKIAKADYMGSGNFSEIKWVENPPSEYGRRGAVWTVEFDDADNTLLYVTPTTGEVKARRSATWRFYDFFWRLHVMDYDDGESFNHPLLIIAALLALLVAMSGVILSVIKTRRSILMWRARRRELAN